MYDRDFLTLLSLLLVVEAVKGMTFLPKHGLARSVAVYGVTRPNPEQLDGLLGRCDQLRIWARAHGFELDGVPDDLALLDQALDQAIDQARGELGELMLVAAVGSQAGLSSAP